MATDESIREKTNAEVPDLGRRVFYTLRSDEKGGRLPADVQADRNSKAIALLVEVLHQNRRITQEQIEDMLLQVVT